MVEEAINVIKKQLDETKPTFTEDQVARRNRILNSDNPRFITHGHKIPDIEQIVKRLYHQYKWSYESVVNIFRALIKSDILEEQFFGIFLLNQVKKQFTESTLDLFYEEFSKYSSCWAFLDTSCIRVIGPFLAKNEELATKTIKKWSNSEKMWVRRGATVILLKIIIIKKDFDENYVFNLVEKMLEYPEEYIQKGIGWLLKTCSKYKLNSIYDYLEKNKKNLPRLILRYGSEKFPKEMRAQILSKDK